MTKGEAEEIFISAIMSGENVVVEMTLSECQVFRVLIGRSIKEMQSKNRNMWLKAREFGIEYVAPYAVIRKLDVNRYKMFKMEDGKMVPFTKTEINESMTKIVLAEKPLTLEDAL
jgi:Cu2+-containing amine oxidase